MVIQTERSSSNIPEVFSGYSAHQIYIYEHTSHFRDNIHYTHRKYSVSFLCWSYRCLFIAQLNLKKKNQTPSRTLNCYDLPVSEVFRGIPQELKMLLPKPFCTTASLLTWVVAMPEFSSVPCMRSCSLLSPDVPLCKPRV